MDRRMRLKKIPEGYYKHCIEMAQPICSDLALIFRYQYDDKRHTTGNRQYFIRYIGSNCHDFDIMITEVGFELLSKAYQQNRSSWCQIYEYIFGKDTVRVFQEDNQEGGYSRIAIGNKDNLEWQEEFAAYV